MNWQAMGGIAGFIILALLIGFLATRHGDREDAAICASLYAHARSIGDTAQIDANVAPKERGRYSLAWVRTCGELRSRGELEEAR